MKVIVLGATGNTGIQLITQALQRGHEVTALVRNPAKLESLKNPNLKIVTCNLLDANELESHFNGQDCILSALGSPGLTIFRITFPLDSIKVIVAAMRKANLKRIICVGSQYTKPGLPYPGMYKMLRVMIGRQLDALNDMEDYLFNNCADDIDFTIVRPPRLLDGPLTDKTPTIGEGKFYFEGDLNERKISRADVAKFMLDIANTNEYAKQGVAIDMPKAV